MFCSRPKGRAEKVGCKSQVSWPPILSAAENKRYTASFLRSCQRQKSSFEIFDLPSIQSFSGFPPEKSSIISKYFLISLDKK
jgi:hypothetical protein